MTTCPSGVHYMHLVDHARAHIEKTYRRPLADRLLRAAARAQCCPIRRCCGWRCTAARLAQPLAPLFAALGLKPLAAMLRLAAGMPAGASALRQRRRSSRRRAARKGRVALLQRLRQPGAGPAYQRGDHPPPEPARHRGRVARGEGCCGALVHHMGREHEAHAQARANIDAWTRGDRRRGARRHRDQRVRLRDHREGLRLHAADRPGLCRQGRPGLGAGPGYQRISGGLAAVGAGPADGLSVAYHAACSLQHGQRIIRQPKELLARFGFIVKDIPEGHLCCGSAGTYNILQSEIAQRLRDRKIEHRSAGTRRDRSRQYRMHHADRVGHGDTGGSPGRVDRLGHGRPEAGGIVRAASAGGCRRGGRRAGGGTSDQLATT